MPPRYRFFKAETVTVSSLAKPAGPRALSPRQLAVLEREEDIKKALNEAAALPASEVYVLHLNDGQKVPAYRAAMARVWSNEPRKLHVVARGNDTILISKAKLPGRAWKLDGTNGTQPSA